jgi:hypothetical protein
MKHLVISPHADDAVWSCGGILAEWAAAGRSITVITVFDADEADGADTVALTPIAVRRAEDIAALAALPADRVGLDFREAALRTAPDGKPRYPSLLALRRAPHPSDEALVPAIARAIAPYAVAADVVHAPLGERTHVDHALARQAADLVVEPWRLRYYGEFPYAPPPPIGLVRTDHLVGFRSWLRLGLVYRSQVDAMFSGVLPFARALCRHAGHVGAARWQEWRVVE